MCYHLVRHQPIPDVELGIGKFKNVFNAQTTGSLTVAESAHQFQTNAKPLTFLENVCLATPVTTSLEDSVCWPQFKILLILDAEHGIGKI